MLCVFINYFLKPIKGKTKGVKNEVRTVKESYG